MPHRKGFAQLIKKYLPYDNTKIRGIEIGCLQGDFNKYLLDEFGNLSMVTIDRCPMWFEVLQNNRKNLERLCVLPFPSDVAIKLLDTSEKYDFIFIDGDHEYFQCKRDIINYAPLVRKGGIVSGHNYHKSNNSAHPGVHQAVDEIYGDRVKLQEDFIWYVQAE